MSGDEADVTASALDKNNWNHEDFPTPLEETKEIGKRCGKDCQRRIDEPKYLTPASRVGSLDDNDLVVVLSYDGHARAYSIDTLENTGNKYIEVINDTLGTTPVAVAY